MVSRARGADMHVVMNAIGNKILDSLHSTLSYKTSTDCLSSYINIETIQSQLRHAMRLRQLLHSLSL